MAFRTFQGMDKNAKSGAIIAYKMLALLKWLLAHLCYNFRFKFPYKQRQTRMITWMQKHKKWLVITIWISAIAFIGAGMVNWGSYGFGSSNDKVARVGDIDIHFNEYNRAYNEVLNEYAQIPGIGKSLDEAEAKRLGLHQIALQRLIQQAQLLNFANDLGLVVDDSEIANEIINAGIYVDSNGQFDANIYKETLKAQGFDSAVFENMLKKMLMIKKLFSVMNISQTQIPSATITPLELSTLTMASSISDRLMVLSLPLNKAPLVINEDELKAFWEANASSWRTPMVFEIEYILSPYNAHSPTEEELKKHYEDFKGDYLNSEGHLQSFNQVKNIVKLDVQKLMAESAAKREYRDLKNGTKSGEIISIKENGRFFIKDGVDLVVEDLKVAQIGQVLKPIEATLGFVTLKLLNKTESVNKSFKEARAEAKVAYEKNKRKEALANLAKSSLNSFNGRDIGYVDRFYTGSIPSLNEEQKWHFLSQVFGSKDKQGYVMFEDKALLYRVLNQKSAESSQRGEDIVMTKGFKAEAVLEYFANYLNSIYKTTIYIDLNK